MYDFNVSLHLPLNKSLLPLMLTSGLQRAGQKSQLWFFEHIWNMQSSNRRLWKEIIPVIGEKNRNDHAHKPVLYKGLVTSVDYQSKCSGSLREESDEPWWHLNPRVLCTSFLSRRGWHRKTPGRRRRSWGHGTPEYRLHERGQEE